MPRTSALTLSAILVVAGSLMVGALLRTSTTFDEIVLVAAGARGLDQGRWELLIDQPPLMAYLYALPLHLRGTVHPSEAAGPWEYPQRYRYARDFYFRAGNDPRQIALLSRLVAVAIALSLVVATWAYTRRVSGEAAGLVAAGLVAFLPDVLAHGGVAYNDLPLALFFFLAVWALDRLVRSPDLPRAIAAGAATALAVGVKFSALALGPAALGLLASEGWLRRRDIRWWKDVTIGALTALAVAYGVTVALYGGDAALLGLRAGLGFTLVHAAEGHMAPAYLLGQTSSDGWWHYFLVISLLKSPAALHLLLPIAAWGLIRSRRLDRSVVTSVLSSPLRAPLVGLLVFGSMLLSSKLNIGIRHALPAAPFILMLTAAGVVRFWKRATTSQRRAVGVLGALYVGSTLVAYPHYLSYTSEYVLRKDEGWLYLADSNLDWGQGLLELRRFQLEEDTGPIQLSYFGSALPAGYGIEYVPLPSFLPLPPAAPDGATSTAAPWTAVSATNLLGLYLGDDDPLAAYRDRRPERVLAGSILLFRESIPVP